MKKIYESEEKLLEKFKSVAKNEINSVKNNYHDVKLYNESGVIILLCPSDYFADEDKISFENVTDDMIHKLKPLTSDSYSHNVEEDKIKTFFIPDGINIRSEVELCRNGYFKVVDNALIDMWKKQHLGNIIYLSTIFKYIFKFIIDMASFLHKNNFNQPYYLTICLTNIKDYQVEDFQDSIHKYKINKNELLCTTEVNLNKDLSDKLIYTFDSFLDELRIPKESILSSIK